MRLLTYEGATIMRWGDWKITESLHRPTSARFGASLEGEPVFFFKTFASCIDFVFEHAKRNDEPLPAAEPITYYTEDRNG